MRNFYGEDILDSYKDLVRDLEDLKESIADVKVISIEEFQNREKLLQTVAGDIASVKGFIAKRLSEEVD